MAEEFNLEGLKTLLRLKMEENAIFLQEEGANAEKALVKIRKLQLFDPFLLYPSDKQRTEPDWKLLTDNFPDFPPAADLAGFYADHSSDRSAAFVRSVWKPFAFAIDTLRATVHPHQEQKAMGFLIDAHPPSHAQRQALVALFLDPTEIVELIALAHEIASQITVKKEEEEAPMKVPSSRPSSSESVHAFELKVNLNGVEDYEEEPEENLLARLLQPVGSEPHRSLEGRLQILALLISVPFRYNLHSGALAEKCGEVGRRSGNLTLDALAAPMLNELFSPLPELLRDIGRSRNEAQAERLNPLIDWLPKKSDPSGIYRELSQLLEIPPEGWAVRDALLSGVGSGAARFVLETLLRDMRDEEVELGGGIAELLPDFKAWAEALVMNFHIRVGNSKAVEWQIRHNVSFSAVYRRKFKTGLLMRLRAQVWLSYYVHGRGLGEKSYHVRLLAEQMELLDPKTREHLRFLAFLLAVRVQPSRRIPDTIVAPVLEGWDNIGLCKISAFFLALDSVAVLRNY